MSFLRVALTAPTVALLALSCGGSAVESRGSGGGQSGGTAGSTSVGGSSSVGGSATGGTGGALPDLCTLPQETGPCEALIPAWWHDPSTGICMPFSYGGCEGNANRFETREACQAACSGGRPNLDACTTSNDCVLMGVSLCFPCDPVDERMLVAINGANSSQYNLRYGPVSCNPCPNQAEAQRTLQNFVPACVAGQCTVLDLRTTAITECMDSSECALRDGSGCCEECDGQGFVAYNANRSAELSQLVCGDVIPPCLACESPIPPSYYLECAAGRCVLHTPLGGP